MELVLTRQPANGNQVAVTCDGQPSHTFDLRTLIPNNQHQPPHPLEDPVAYGSAVYTALFPPATSGRRQLENAPDRILLVTSDNELDAVPWEYAHGAYSPPVPSYASSSEGFLVLECHFVRGLPPYQRLAPPKLEHSPHIIAIPSNPLSRAVEPLNIEGEWLRLREALQDKTLQDYAIILERTRPPTLARLGLLVANQHNRIVHFMGHGGQDEKKGTILCFEKDNGDLDIVSAKDFTRQVRGAVFLVTLNACASATPGKETDFSNLAAALVRQKTPYALGMRFSIPDDDALTFSRTFYSYLVRGSSVEEAVYRVRLALARNEHRPWLVGMPVLYTALSAPANGFASTKGAPVIEEHQPRIEATALPRAEGTFQGRADDLKALGDSLTGDPRRRIITIHGGGGQGKTALAREAIERFAYVWPAGVWATTFENLPARDVFLNDLARFLGITPDPAAESFQLERQVLSQLGQRRTLIVLDNAETLVDAVEARNASAIHLAELVKQLPSPMVSLLVTSRVQLGWPEETSLELGGLSPQEGAALFRQSAPQRSEAVDLALAKQLSRRVGGHPLSLRLLGGAFNASAITLPAFLAEYEAQLVKAENTYVSEQHRQRTLYASIETSVRYLDEDHRRLLSRLWLFHAPFLPQIAAQIFDPQATPEEGKEPEDQRSPIYDRLHTLWRRGLVLRETFTVREGMLSFYSLPPTMRPYVEQFLARTDERETLLARFGTAYTGLVVYLRRELDLGGVAAAMALLLRADLERGASCVTGVEQGYYWLRWGWILQRLGYRKSGLELTEQALQVGQEQDQKLKSHALNNMAAVYQQTGQPQQALKLYEQALPLMRKVGDRAGEAATLNGLAGVYADTGQPQQAIKHFEQALPLTREVGDRAREATTLNGTALVYQQTGQPQQAIKLYKQALPLAREVSDRAREATILNNMAGVYADTGQPQQAIKHFEQALPLMREVGDRAGEAATLNNIALVYQSLQRYAEAQVAFEQSIALAQQVSHRALEIAGLVDLALLLYQDLNRPQEAITGMEQALAVLVATGLPQDAAGHTKERLQQHLNDMRQGVKFGQATNTAATMPPAQVQQIVANTIAVMTVAQEQRAEWREVITKALQNAQQRGSTRQIEVELFSAVLDILDGKPLTLPTDHPYAQAVTAIQEGIATGGPRIFGISDELMQAVRDFVNAENWEATRHIVETRQAVLFRPEVETLFEQNIAQARASRNERAADMLELHLSILRDCKTSGMAATFERIEAARQAAEELPNLPFDSELITRSIEALAGGGPQEKMQCMQYLAAQASQASDMGAKALINTLQLALFGSPLAQLGQDLEGVYRQAWDAIVAGVEQAGGTAS